MPNAPLEIVEQAGHTAHDEQPAEVLRIVRRFLTTAGQSAESAMFSGAV